MSARSFDEPAIATFRATHCVKRTVDFGGLIAPDDDLAAETDLGCAGVYDNVRADIAHISI